MSSVRQEARGWGWLPWAAVLAVVTGLYVRPLWMGAYPPLTDFGGHLALADAWARHADVALYRSCFTIRDSWAPNLLVYRFVGALYPALSPLAALRLWVSASLVLTVVATATVARAFDRSPWQVLLALPFLWNGMFALGLVSYAMAVPLVLFGVTVARRTGSWGRPVDGVGLIVLGVLAYFVHAIGAAFFVGAAALVLALSARRLRHLGYGAGLVLPLLLLWRWASEGGAATRAAHAPLEWRPLWNNLVVVLRQGTDVLVGGVDTIVLLVVVAAWVVLMGQSTRPSLEPAAVTLRPGGRLLRWLRQQTLLVLVLALGAGLFALPAYVGKTSINPRVIPLFLFTAVLLPRLPRRSAVAASALAVVAVAASVYALRLGEATRAFERTRVAPLVAILDRVPRQSRVACIEPCAHSDSVYFFRRPLCAACRGLAPALRDAFAGGEGFHPPPAYSPLALRPGCDRPLRFGGWSHAPRLDAWDYVVVWEERPRERRGSVRHIATEGFAGSPSGAWSLYAVPGR